MTKYKEYFEKMIFQNKALFDAFKKLHDQYSLDQEKWQEKFNQVGEEVMTVIRDYEARLCRTSEQGGYNRFTPQLAEKFQDEVKKHFPMIDHVGLIIRQKPKFLLKKISLK
jgi:hypothetical protein